jgi:flagellar protein FliS
MKNSYKAYKTANYTAPKTRQVVMLYDGIIRHLNQAREAMLNKDIETRYHRLVRASEIIIGLQMSLDFDQGKEAAQVLYDLYSTLDSRISKLHRTNDVIECDALVSEIKEMREFWNRIDRGAINPDGTVNNQELSTPHFSDADQSETNVAATSDDNTKASGDEYPQNMAPGYSNAIAFSA